MDINEEGLKKRYIELSNNELFEIIDNKFGYTDLAVKLAIRELSRRDISENDVHSYKSKLIEDFEESVLKIVHYDLKMYQKVLFYIFWLPILNFAFKINFREKKEYLKLKQANYYSLLGFIFFMITGIVSVVFDFSNWSSLFLWLASLIPTYVFDETLNRERFIKKLNDKFQWNEVNEKDHPNETL